ncbi:MAG: nuclease-related domain-containing protein [Oscillospiraceae bacterium]|nr:nuclease-related domain-containing protein [Oscillospiraceae bacterium]
MWSFLKEWWPFLLVCAAAVLLFLLLPLLKKRMGEKAVSIILNTLPPDSYHIFRQLLIEGTAVDYVIVSPFGVFFLQAKDYKGWLTGHEKDAQWTQNTEGKQKAFPNPILQNQRAAEALRRAVPQLPAGACFPLVAFPGDCTLRLRTETPILKYGAIGPAIRAKRACLLDDDTISRLCRFLSGC